MARCVSLAEFRRQRSSLDERIATLAAERHKLLDASNHDTAMDDATRRRTAIEKGLTIRKLIDALVALERDNDALHA